MADRSRMAIARLGELSVVADSPVGVAQPHAALAGEPIGRVPVVRGGAVHARQCGGDGGERRDVDQRVVVVGKHDPGDGLGAGGDEGAEKAALELGAARGGAHDGCLPQ